MRNRAVTQAKHVVPVKKSSKPLVSNGVDRSLIYNLPDIFSFKAKDSGYVESIDEDLKLMTIKYDNGKTDAIDIAEKLTKNSSGGFYEKLEFEILYKVNERFNKGDILMKNSNFFKGNTQGDIAISMGKLSKLAITQLDGTLINRAV